MEEKEDVSKENVQIQLYLPSSAFRSEFKKIQNGGKNMKGNHPKRRRDKYNPYQIYEKEGNFYISFRDGQRAFQEFQIDEQLYRAFNEFELEDLSYLNEWDRHLEQSEVYEPTLSKRALHQPEDLEETVLKKIWRERLHKAIEELPEIQKRRIVLYYFDCLTYEQIARKEGCTKRAVKSSIDHAKEKMKKFFEI